MATAYAHDNPADRDAARDAGRWWRSRVPRTDDFPNAARDLKHLWALAPAGGIPAATGTGASTVFGSADCELYDLDTSDGSLRAVGLNEKVWNMAGAVSAGVLVGVTRRGSEGAWHADVEAC